MCQTQYIFFVLLIHKTRSGNFIIEASGSDKQMLCASSGARVALNIAAEKRKQKRKVSHSSKESVFVG